MRGLKNKPFWNTETSTCWNGAVATTGDIRPEGFCRVNSWLPIVLGGEANMYWLWRQHSAGHEVMHGAVLYPSGRPMHIFDEVREVSHGFEKCSEFLSKTHVETDVAFMVSTVNATLMKFQPIFSSKALSSYTKRIVDIYEKISRFGIRLDVIGAGKSLDRYKVLFTPFLMTLEEQSVGERIKEWVKGGGTWICGPLCDIRNAIGAHYTSSETGFHEEMTGGFLAYQIPDASHKISLVHDADGEEFLGEEWLQLYDIQQDSKSIVSVRSGYSSLVGKSVVFEKKYGKGKIIVLGTIPSQKDMEKLLDIALENSNTERIETTGDVVAAIRKGNGTSGIAVLEYGGKNGSITLKKQMRDIISGKIHSGETLIEPYTVMILEEI